MSTKRWLANRFGALLCCAATLSACATAQPATTQQLAYRAAFDLGCSPAALQIYPIDGLTKGVYGCGRRLIYVERCESQRAEPLCTWALDSPSAAPPCVPQGYAAQAPAEPDRRSRVDVGPNACTDPTSCPPAATSAAPLLSASPPRPPPETHDFGF